MVWWSDNHIYRRKLSIAASAIFVNEGHPIAAILSRAIKINGKVREDAEDVEVVYRKLLDNDTYEYIRLPRVVVHMPDDTLQVLFLSQTRIEPFEHLYEDYRIYYGDLDLAAELEDRPEFEDGELDQWPIKVNYNDGPIAYTRPGDHWKAGKSSTRGARATFMGHASQIRLISVTGPDKGVLEIQMNGSDWQLVDLFDNVEEDIEQVVFEAVDLEPTEIHELRIRVSGERNPKASSDQVNVARVEYAKPIIVEDVGEEVNDIGWSSATGGA